MHATIITRLAAARFTIQMCLYNRERIKSILLATPLAHVEGYGVGTYNDSFHFPLNLGENIIS
jgi:hypothetical protein